MIRLYENRDDAETAMRAFNRTNAHAEPRVLIDGPDNNYAVVDLRDAIDGNFLYQWAQ